MGLQSLTKQLDDAGASKFNSPNEKKHGFMDTATNQQDGRRSVRVELNFSEMINPSRLGRIQGARFLHSEHLGDFFFSAAGSGGDFVPVVS